MGARECLFSPKYPCNYQPTQFSSSMEDSDDLLSDSSGEGQDRMGGISPSPEARRVEWAVRFLQAIGIAQPAGFKFVYTLAGSGPSTSCRAEEKLLGGGGSVSDGISGEMDRMRIVEEDGVADKIGHREQPPSASNVLPEPIGLGESC